ncbi:antitoxin [Sphingomonas sp. Y38-1Y]|uniref:antitoxin n=1 Tax=Sphingomonas sp. Y38-1Y TaxID=3078265 RepID=UPI0028E4CB61|nr:antitoxin [Sphingomonas sp. Y38-1Y]
MEHEPGIFETRDEEADAEADARAMADYRAGRSYPHSVVKQWLRTWGDPDFKPFDEWLKSSG